MERNGLRAQCGWHYCSRDGSVLSDLKWSKGAFDALVKKDAVLKDQLKSWSSTELAVVLGIVFRFAAYGVTKLELKQHEKAVAEAITNVTEGKKGEQNA